MNNIDSLDLYSNIRNKRKQSRKLFIKLNKHALHINKINIKVCYRNWLFNVKLFYYGDGYFINYKSDFYYDEMKPIWIKYFKELNLLKIADNQYFVIPPNS